MPKLRLLTPVPTPTVSVLNAAANAFPALNALLPTKPSTRFLSSLSKKITQEKFLIETRFSTVCSELAKSVPFPSTVSNRLLMR